jgi:uncharacterized protein (TIGR02996 family)
MTITDEEGLVRALEEDPFDTVTRSVYADLLEERGDWRAGAHRETARLTARSFRTDWSHPVAAYYLRMDKAKWPGGTFGETESEFEPVIHLLHLKDYGKLNYSHLWSLEGQKLERQKLERKHGMYFRDKIVSCYIEFDSELENHHQEHLGVGCHVWMTPNTFAEILIREGYGR